MPIADSAPETVNPALAGSVMGSDAALSRSHATNLARQAWDEAAPLHERLTLENLVEKFRDPAFGCLDAVHVAELQRIGLTGRAVAQFNTNNGRELISVQRLGAERCVGFDISTGFVGQAREIAAAAGNPCEFVVSDIYEIPQSFHDSFDLVFATAGALCFMPDLEGYFSVARKLLKSGGRISLYDCHPILDMYKLDRERNGMPPALEFSYFDEEPKLRQGGLDYHSNSTYDAKPIYYFHHRLSSILMASIRSGFDLEFFDEYPIDPSQACRSLERVANQPPLSFILTARKIG